MVFVKKDGPDAEEYGPRIGVRLKPSTYRNLQKQASDHGLTVSDIVRKRCDGVKITSKMDAQMILELRRLGGLLKLLVKGNPTGFDVKKVDALLDEIAVVIRRLSEK